jgi:hypothetical protein
MPSNVYEASNRNLGTSRRAGPDAAADGTVREALDSVVREHSGESGPAVVTAQINIGIRTK